MSQPTAIVAKIQITEDNYKKYVRKEAGAVLAQEIFDNLKNGYRDFYVFKYLKKENALYAFLYFHYGNGDFLLKHPLLAMLQKAADYAAENAAGYLIATLDCLNNAPQDFVYAAALHNKTFAPHEFGKDELKAYWKDAQKHFFKKAETDFALAMPSVVDKAVLKKVAVLREANRIQTLKNSLHTASVEKPIELFKAYFYNGKYFYKVRNNDAVIFSGINLQELRQTPYGVCDDKSVIAGSKHIITEPSKFKMWQKGETVFFSSAESVYSGGLEAYPDSDGASYKMLNEYIGEDKKYIYFMGIQLPKKETGDYKINTSGYFHKNILLYTKTQVRTRDIIFENIDAPTFEILSEDAQAFCKKHGLINPTGAYAGCFILHCRDKNGELIIHNYDADYTKIEVERIASLEEYLAKTKLLLLEMEKERKSRFYPEAKGNDALEYYTNMNEWLAENFEEKYKLWQYNSNFYIALNNYFHSCFELYQQTKSAEYLHSGAALSDKLYDDFFVNPYIYHNLACIFAALGETEKAVKAVAGAVYFGYEKTDLIWKDGDLKSLFSNTDFIALKKYYENIRTWFPVINTFILEKIEQITDDYSKRTMQNRVLNTFTFWQETGYDNDRFSPEEKTYYAALKPMVARFLNDALSNISDYWYKKNYERYKYSIFLTLHTHWMALRYFFVQAHSQYGNCSVSYCLPISDKIKALISAHQNEEEPLIQEIKESGINKIFGVV